MKTARDRLDVHDVSWFESKARPGDVCCHCDRAIDGRYVALVERVLPRVVDRPKVLHRKCWASYNERLGATP